jgi:hypothetical protein
MSLWDLAYKISKYKSNLTITEVLDKLIKVSIDPKAGDRIKFLLKNPELKKFIEEYKINEIRANLNKLSLENQDKIKQITTIIFKDLIFPMTERIFKASSTSFEPNFLIPPIKVYKKGDINIEEYDVNTPEGDNLVYAMAYDIQGRVYIDNIYDKNSKITPYGTYSNLINAGMLIWKPEDYQEQTAHISPDFKGEKGEYADEYTDISDIFSLIPIVKKYREHLKSRGVYVRELKSKKS